MLVVRWAERPGYRAALGVADVLRDLVAQRSFAERRQAGAQRGVFRRIFASRVGSGNRTGLEQSITRQAHQALGRRTHDRPLPHLQQRGKRRGILPHQPRKQRRRHNRGIEFGQPAARQIDLEHVARADVVLDALDPIHKCSRIIFVQAKALRQGRNRRHGPREIVRHGVDQSKLPGLRHQHTTSTVAFKQDRSRDARQPGKRKAGIFNQAHSRFEQSAQFICKDSQPPPAKRQAMSGLI